VASFIARPGGTLTGPGGMTTDVTAGPQAGFFPSTGLGAAGAIGAGGLLGAIGLPVRAATAGPEQTAGPGAKDRGAAGPHGLGIPGTDGVLSGAIGATASLAGRPGGRSREADKGFTGTIGHSREARGRIAGRLAHGQAADGHLAGMTAAVRKAPVAGFSLGSGHGSVLQESAVPVISAKSPGITSSSVNAQLTPAGPAPGEGGPGVIGGVGGVLGRQGAEAGGDGLMMMPPAGMGGGSQQRQERERRAYLPQDEDYWGTEPELPEPAVGAEDRRAASEPEFAGPRVIAGIGAEAGPAASTQTRPDRRMP